MSTVTPGVYNIFTADSSLLLDLPWQANRSVILSTSTGVPTQKWTVQPARQGNGYIIRNTTDGTFLQPANASPGAPLVAKQQPFKWGLQPTNGGRYFIRSPIAGGTAVSKTGGSGSPVKNLAFQPGPNQAWFLTKV